TLVMQKIQDVQRNKPAKNIQHNENNQQREAQGDQDSIDAVWMQLNQPGTPGHTKTAQFHRADNVFGIDDRADNHRHNQGGHARDPAKYAATQLFYLEASRPLS